MTLPGNARQREKDAILSEISRITSESLFKYINGIPDNEQIPLDVNDRIHEYEISLANIRKITDRISATYPLDFKIIKDNIAEGKAAIKKANDDEELEEIKALLRQEEEAEKAKLEESTLTGRPLLNKDLFALRQQEKAGIITHDDLRRAKEQAKGAKDNLEIEVSEMVPRFLQGKVRRRLTNFCRAPVNLAEKKAKYAEEVLNGKMSSMACIAEKQERLNVDRNKLRGRKRADERIAAMEKAAAMATSSPEDVYTFTQGELDEKPITIGDINSGSLRSRIPPWLRQSLGDVVDFGKKSDLPISEQRRRLPVYSSREEIIDHVANHTVTILQGETGSGKTTQIPQYLLENGFARDGKIIAVTQPRRVAAVELAKRVAEEQGCRCGEDVGYTVRFEDKTSSLTKIKYMTDGMLLREALLNDTFDRYSVIVLDEAHERSITTDVLFGVLKKAIKKRPTLKVIVTSATMDLEKFCLYFGANEPFKIKGRTHPVETVYLDTPQDDYVFGCIQKALQIHINEPDGDILIFLTGQDEVDTAAERLHAQFMRLKEMKMARDLEIQQEAEGKAGNSNNSDNTTGVSSTSSGSVSVAEGTGKTLRDMLVLPCYAVLPSEAMTKVFEPAPPNTRKVVIATNVAETSITIDGLRYVVDCGFCKQQVYDPRNDVERLKIVPVSKAQATQREGRAGRTGPGRCYRLYTEAQFQNEMEPTTVPEIQRTNLTNIVLTLKAVGIGDLFDFDFLDAPPRDTLVKAMQKLRYLGALDDDGVLTDIGQKMAALPLQPSESKTLLKAIELGCAPSVMTIVSMQTMRTVFYKPRDRQEEADAARRLFLHQDGDQLTLLNVYNRWENSGRSDEWCRSNFINPRAMTESSKARQQLIDMLTAKKEYKAKLEVNHTDSILIRKAITAGFFFNVAKMHSTAPQLTYVTMRDRREVQMYRSSAIYPNPPRYLLFHELNLTPKCEYMREVMAVNPQWLVELAPEYFRMPRDGELTREQRAKRVEPILMPWENSYSWRISKQRAK